jgi:hypothetical protein
MTEEGVSVIGWLLWQARGCKLCMDSSTENLFHLQRDLYKNTSLLLSNFM